MSPAIRQHVLGDRYQLIAELGAEPDGSELWIAADADETPLIAKTWSFPGDAPDPVNRALWDTTLRVLYRISSSSGASKALLLLRDAGIDLRLGGFAMVLRAPGQNFVRLSDALRQRPDLYPTNTDERLDAWRALARIAGGIELLHQQQVLHRNVGPEVAFLDPGLGIDSLRLVGFEWSTRVGMASDPNPLAGWCQPPELFAGDSTFQLETDWFGFGMLAARLLMPLENHASNAPLQRYERTVAAIRGRNVQQLSKVEREFLLALLEQSPVDRLDRVDDIVRTVDEILKGLEYGGPVARSDEYLVLALNHTNQAIVDAAEASGFIADTTDPSEPYNPNDRLHRSRLLEYVRADLAEQPRLIRLQGQDRYMLAGDRLSYWLLPFFDKNLGAETWEVGFCPAPADLRGGTTGSSVDLAGTTVSVRTIAEAYDSGVRRHAMSWTRVLPAKTGLVELRPRSQQLLDIVRATNQIELLLRDAEIFPYRVVRQETAGYQHRLVIAEGVRERSVASYARVRGGLIGFLRNELATRKPRWDEVVLSDTDSLTVQADDDQFWYIESLNDDGTVTLTRTGESRGSIADGYLRTVGMLIGQSRLMQRRTAALDRLKDHSYLLDALANPGQVFMDTGEQALPIQLLPSDVDSPKRAAIEDVLRVRPVYTLQGPPGTGKTTMVAWLIREILADDPVAQILVTAQAHGAVDVLRDKVARDVFARVSTDDRPIAIRLAGEDDDVRGGINDVSVELLERARERLDEQSELSPVQAEWLGEIDLLIAAIDPEQDYDGDESVGDFREVVRRGASITYCTTSDRGLEAIAKSKQSYDWSIVEEAGKAHSFDLVMPLQAGHRWLLIGDHHQLPPYRFENYRDALADLDGVAAALRQLPMHGGGLIDDDWIREWDDTTPEQREAFKTAALRWLESFRALFERCERASGADSSARTTTESVGAAAGILTMQHRMHPTIGDLISECYYEGQIGNATLREDGTPLDRVLHGFAGPQPVVGRAIVWLDTPWSMNDPRWVEEGTIPYTNANEATALCNFVESLKRPADDTELTLALLSPYNHQVKLLRDELRRTKLPTGVLPKPHQRRRHSQDDDMEPGFTVDSFQGNQADIVGISLVRNNTSPPGDGLGFLAESSRINVLLSRAERLLILAGSWDFFAHQVSTISEDDTTHPLLHWKRVITSLERSFADGSAIRVSVA